MAGPIDQQDARGFSVSLVYDDSEVQAALNELERRCVDMTPVFASIAEVMRTSTKDTFDAEGRPEHWKPRAESTLQQIEEGHARSGWRAYDKILSRSGRLQNSITTRSGKDFAEQGVALSYAAIHQFGGEAGRGRKTTIPARPYLVIQDEDLAEDEATIADYLAASFGNPGPVSSLQPPLRARPLSQ